MAVGLAAEVKESVGVDLELIESGGGKFEVTAEGELVFSKKETKRFPELGEVSRLLKAKAG